MKVRASLQLVNGKVPGWFNWRIQYPFERLNIVFRGDSEENSFEAIEFDIDSELENDIDILILPRIVVAREHQDKAARWFKKIKEQGTVIVYEVDDDIFSESYVSQLSKLTWKHDLNSNPSYLVPVINTFELQAENAVWTMRQCDAVTTSNAELGTYIQSLIISGQEVYVVPNALDYDKFAQGLNKRTREAKYVSIGWAGGTRNDAELQMMLDAWLQIAYKYDNVQFVVGGHIPDVIKEDKVLSQKTICLGWKEADKYAGSMQVDIGCCIVGDSPFSKRKSPIKAWEYAMADACIVASVNVYNYEPIIMLATDVEEWVTWLSYLIENPAFRRNQATLYKKHVKDYHLLDTQIWYWEQVYSELLEKKNKRAVEIG